MEKKLLNTEEAEPPGSRTKVPDLEAGGVLPRDLESLRNPFRPLPSYADLVRTSARTALKFPISPASDEFRARCFPEATAQEWSDWHWQLKRRIRDVEPLARVIKLSEDERNAIARHRGPLPVAITPYYMGLVDPQDPDQPIRRTVVPVSDEYLHLPGEAMDPLEEDRDSPVPGLVHRYPDRVLFLLTNFCSTNCRYCTRSRMISGNDEHSFSVERWEKGIAYIEANPRVRDVLISGGDPLTLSDEKLEWILKRLHRIPHVEMVRIGTKAPVVLPQRITSSLTRMLKRYHPLWMSIHFTHPDELTPETIEACNRLADAGIPLGSQTVLLAGINDQVETLARLFHGLVKIRVKPYYLFQCDPIIGSSHFRTSVKKGLRMIEGLRGHTTGYAVPNYVIDLPGGGGKVTLVPNYLLGRQGDELVLRNYQNKEFRYPDPQNRMPA